MLPRWAVASLSICWRSSRLNRDCAFCGFRMTATMTTSKWRAVRSMMSRWPRVTGSKDPGQRAVATELPSDRRIIDVDEDHQRIAERALPAGAEPRRRPHFGSGRAFHGDHGAGRQPPGLGERAQQLAYVVVGGVVGRV